MYLKINKNMLQKIKNFILENEKFDSVLKVTNYVVLSFNVIMHAYQGNWVAAVGWGLALLWCSNYFVARKQADRWFEMTNDAMEGWGKCVEFISQLEEKAKEIDNKQP